MLVLSRRIGEKICIGDGIVVTVIASRGNRLRLGIEAPAGVTVDRAEVRARKAVNHERTTPNRFVPALPR